MAVTTAEKSNAAGADSAPRGTPPPPAGAAGGDGARSASLRLTDFMDVATLQEIQDSFAAVANVKATITDADGNVLTQATPTSDFLKRQQAIATAEELAAAATPGAATSAAAQEGPQKEGREYVAPIMVGGQRLGTIRMSANAVGGIAATFGLDEAKLAGLATKFGLDGKQVKGLVTQLNRARNVRPAAIQFLFLLANAVARLCYQEFQLRQRVNELTAVYTVASILSDARDLSVVLQRTVQVVCEVMGVKAASIRLIDEEKDELVIRAVHNLSRQYQSKGPVRHSTAAIDAVALGPQGYEYVRDMKTDPRIQYPQEARREGVVSMLSAGMRYKGKAIGVLRVYTDRETTFSQLQTDMLKAIAAQAAGAIENARLLAETLEAEQLERQVQTAAEVQLRMIPQTPPKVPGLQLASAYVPAHRLGGDFYDFIPLPDDNWGLVIADVSGKGVPASLTMAAVRAALRAQVDNVYYLYEVMRRVNVMVCRDTKPSEFVSLFYGVYDARNRRLTYSNAGHLPPALLRDGKATELLESNLVLGVDPDEQYTQAVVDLRPGDCLMLYTDGLTEAMNFKGELFGRHRVLDTFARCVSNCGGTAETIAENMLWDVRKFVGIAPRSDDMTMLVACVK